MIINLFCNPFFLVYNVSGVSCIHLRMWKKGVQIIEKTYFLSVTPWAAIVSFEKLHIFIF
jgi:hypothetical protein